MKNILLFSLLLAGCGAADEPSVDAGDLARPPARPAQVSAGSRRWFVIDHWDLGTSEPNGWRHLGYDLDGRITTKDESRANKNTACARASGSPSGALEDGEHGIDNAFGAHFMSVVKSLMSDVEPLTNERLAKGGYTLALRLDNVGADDNASVPGALYLVGPRATPPRFTADETWPVADFDENMPPLQVFSSGYMSKGVWVSGELGKETINVGVPFLGDAVVAKLVGGAISVRVSDGGGGVIAGAIGAQQLIETITPSLMRRGVCPGQATFGAYQSTVTLNADVGIDSTSCNAMSVGIGFTMKPIAGLKGATGVPPVAPPACDAASTSG